MITQGKFQYVRLHQFPSHKGHFTIQSLISWPHSKRRQKYYYNNYIVLESVYNDRPIAVVYFDSGGAFGL